MNHPATELNAQPHQEAGSASELETLYGELDQMGKRCLALEQKNNELQMWIVNNSIFLNRVVLEPALLYDTGSGFTVEKMMHMPALIGEDHIVTAEFTLPEDAVKLRFDPDEQACMITDLKVSGSSRVSNIGNGMQLSNNSFVFPNFDPNLYLSNKGGYKAGQKIRLTFRYYQLNQSPLAGQGNVVEQLGSQVCQLKDELAAANQNITVMQSSTIWKISAPLRKLLDWLHRED